MAVRNLEEWRKEVNEDMALIGFHLSEAERAVDDEARTSHFAMARKEAGRLASDVQRVAEDVYSIHKDELDAVQT